LRLKEPPMSFPDEAATAPSEAEGSPPFPSPPPDPAPPNDPEPSLAVVDATEEAAAPASSPEPIPTRVSAQRPLPRIIAVANQKGGVGKTTTTINVGACLAELGQRTLIIDLDPQGNASTGLGIENRGLETSMYHVLMHEVPLENCIEPTDVKGLFVAPASLDLAGAEIELVPAFSRETRLKRSIDAVLDDFDYVLIDCPPSLGLLTVNGLSAAREVLVPIQCEYYALEGLGQLLRNVDLVRRNLNPELEVSTIVCVMYDARTKLADQVVGEVREHFGEKVLRTIVPRSVRLSEAPSFGQPIITFDPRSRGAFAYRDVAKEVHDDSAQRVG
jgi:chromosome partitioning protein